MSELLRLKFHCLNLFSGESSVAFLFKKEIALDNNFTGKYFSVFSAEGLLNIMNIVISFKPFSLIKLINPFLSKGIIVSYNYNPKISILGYRLRRKKQSPNIKCLSKSHSIATLT
ncbi:hypothetical protein Anas_12268 [Armadillidium nasatum]|uniref:Uncharacterized protein n=1 Tax=Armadillidium nasatum TaxID=96803 RepID=A0A5N5T690_9CRUS|nr:hypothetical protein Anas_12268 [Armadillidium nasatum]